MALPAPRPRMTLEEFLVWEAEQPERWEFVGSEAFAMAGGSDVHNTISLNTAFALRAALRGTRCGVFMSDMKLRVAQTGDVFYPDVFVTCSEADRTRRQDKCEPLLIAEVLSPSTEAYDRGAKFAAYRRLTSVQTVLFLTQGAPQVECFTRTAQGDWLLTEARGADAVLRLPALDAQLALAELYRDLPDADNPPPSDTPATPA